MNNIEIKDAESIDDEEKKEVTEKVKNKVEKPKSQREMVFELIKAVTNGREREAGTHMRDFLTKEEKQVIRMGIYNWIQADAVPYKKDKSDPIKLKKYASCLLCDAFKKDPRYQ